MKIKLDENISSVVAGPLRGLGHDVDTVVDERLSGSDDDTVWAAAQREGRFLITSDLDFADVRKFTPHTHCGLLLLRLREPSRRAVEERLLSLFQSGDVGSWEGCVVVASDHRVRALGRRSP
jgi:predicted nuclease of predicted toxin-antitoxin system